ncbi:uncharacterized protein [Epargyreus clarus]|uniref:uncharacterized protein n=1 Tax=Epargyreus clarus TaxID=520877 RepID=UPI003C2AF084
MDRLNQLRGDAGASRDSTLDTSSLPSEAYMTANDSSKFFSLSEVDSSFVESPSKDAGGNTANSTESDAEGIISNLSPIPKKSELDSFKIGEQIEAANILSGGVNIFDDNENSYDEDELVIDDAVQEGEDKPAELKMEMENESGELPFEKTERLADTSMEDAEASPSKDTEVVLQINGKNVDAIDIGNGLYLYRKEGEEELAAVQILDDEHQQPIIKFLKVRENAEGNLEVYEEIEIEVPKEVPVKEGKSVKNTSHIPVKEVNKVIEPVCNKVAESQALPKDASTSEVEPELNKDNPQLESKTEVNLNGKMMKFSESRKSPLIGTLTHMTYHSTPNKEGIPLTKTMVDLQLHPNRHSENVKKTIEVHTDNCKQRLLETPTKNSKDANECIKTSEVMVTPISKELLNDPAFGQPDANSQENIKCSDNEQVLEQKTDEKVALDVNNGVKSFDKDILENKDNKTEISEIVTTSQLGKILADSEVEVKEVAEKEVDIKTKEIEDKYTTSNVLKEEATNNEVSSKDNNKCVKIQSDHLGPKTEEEKHNEHENITTKDSSAMAKKEIEPSNITTKTESENIKNKTKVIAGEQHANDTIISSDNNPPTENNISNHLETPARSNIERNSTEITKRDMVLETLQKDVEMNDSMGSKQPEKSIIKTSDSLSKCIEGNSNKVMEQHTNISLQSSRDSVKDPKLLNNIEMKDCIHQSGQKLESTSTEVELKANTQTELPVNVYLNDNVSKKPEDKSTKCIEIISDVLLKQPEETKNASQASEQVKSSSDVEIKQPEVDKSKVNLLKDIEKKDDTESFKDSLKAGVDKKKIENEPKQKVDNLLQSAVNKVNVQLREPENRNLPKSNLEATKLTARPDIKTTKGLVITDGSHSRNSLPVKTSAEEATCVLKKSEPNKKVPESQQHTRISLPYYESKSSHSVQTNQKEAERTKKEPVKFSKSTIPKPNNNIKAVPFGKWTEANRQEFLNKIKEAKVPTSTSNTKQLKQANDLNRRDVLQKIDSQRQSNIASAKVQELITVNKHKNETPSFVSKSNVSQPEKTKDNKVLPTVSKTEETSKPQIQNKVGHGKKLEKDQPPPVVPMDMSNSALNTKKDPVRRKEINNQDLIDKTIEGIINRAVTAKLGQDDVKQNIESVEKPKNSSSIYNPVSLDEIESKMNELHGIPFVERPPHELPQVFEHENKSTGISDVPAKGNKAPNLLPFANKPPQKAETKISHPVIRAAEESDEEIIEHEPITGDIELNKNNLLAQLSASDKVQPQESITIKSNSDSKKETIITENDFDKFARRNSINYENRLTVNFDGKEQHNVIQTVVEKEGVPKKLSRNEIMLAESKAKSNKHIAMRHNNSSKIPTSAKTANEEDSYNKNYQSKVQIAYQSVMSAKRQQECPITIIEDKPVKVVFMDATTEFTPHQLNVQGKELSPPKKAAVDWDHFTHSNSESLDSDILDTCYDGKSQDDTKLKSKHQRKQVLTPVETPELELIEPRDLGIEVSPKKKRKIEDKNTEKNCKTLVPKKSYLLNRNVTTDDTPAKPADLAKTSVKESINKQDVFIKHSDPISAIDNLVKAAELLENQSENKNALSPSDQNSVIQQNTPAKRGRGRPRKYPLPEGSDSKSPSPVKTPTPQKKPRLIDAKVPKHDTESEEDEVDSDGKPVKVNWTMGKINENIVCPICNKLFRSENVVFKHVKHCTGPSPSRSDSDKRSPRRMRQSQELDWKSEGSRGSDSMDIDDFEIHKSMKKVEPKETRPSIDDKADVIVIEDTPVKTIEKREKSKQEPNKTTSKTNVSHIPSSLVCEFCGKTFRQLSYLVSHKLQHKNIETKKTEKEQVQKPLFSCETCKKEFRKLHHLVQHRIIHNPNPMSSRSSRKSSSEQSDTKTVKDGPKNEDQSAGFRCEPCDKSFRKLHHLVEHRETHDEINKKCNTATTSAVDSTKPNALHHCDVCKKTFKKLQHLIEHKEHHLDTSSEKSDDKSVQSSLSTKDIIHECPLCYMVFPNEHSLNKHAVFCQKKKKTPKQPTQIDENQDAEGDDEAKITEPIEEKVPVEEKIDSDVCVVVEDDPEIISEHKETDIKIVEKLEWTEQKKVEVQKEIKPVETALSQPNTQISEKDKSVNKKDGGGRNTDKVPVKSRKHSAPTAAPVEIIKIPDTPTPKKKPASKEKATGATVTKRQKTTNLSLPVIDDVKTAESSDDDDVRYMLNPDFKMEETSEVKMFMKVRANKRNSLQIERPNSKDLVKRRISLQHPPKIPRLKVKPIPRKPINTNTVVKSSKTVPIQPDPVPSTDSDDSDVKYSFPVKKEVTKDVEKKVKRQTTVEKRKSLSNIAKRKSLGKKISAKHKVNPSPVKQIKKRTTEVEHRCDCGQLFSSAALLSRHTSLAHTPPRIRRRRSPPPDNDSKLAKPPQKTEKSTPKSRKSVKPDAARNQVARSPKAGVATRKSSAGGEARPTPRRAAPHRGAPVPEKMRKLMDKSKK